MVRRTSTAETFAFEGDNKETPPPNFQNAAAKPSRLRRLMARAKAAIYIDDASVKITLVRANAVEKWGTVPLEPDIVKNGIITNPDLLSSKIRNLLKENRIRVKKLVVGLSGLHAITKVITLPHVPKKLLPDAISHEAERELPVSIDTVYLSWQIIQQSFLETSVFLVAYSRDVIDPLVKTLSKAGIASYTLELGPLALSRIANTPTSAVFDVRPGEMDIVITTGNVPDVVRSVPLPRDRSIEENLPIIREELERTISFYKPETTDRDIPFFGFGELELGMFEYLSTASNSIITSPYPPLYYPEEFSPRGNAISLGLLMPEQKTTDPAYPKIATLNLLPLIYQKPLLPDVLFVISTVLVLGGLIFSVAQFALAMDKTTSYREQLSAAQQTLAGRQAELLVAKKALTTLDAQVSQADKDMKAITNSMNDLAVR
ncbi:MAG: pilus assembly protein PilM, partial [Dehalococcoidales bacterium]|nr:pilus assembly protein PilM [Dehalococcoidales bacterium]